MSSRSTTYRHLTVWQWLIQALLLLLLPIDSTAQQLTEKYDKSRPVIIVCDWDKPPYEFADDEGRPAGSNIDVLKEIFDELGLRYTFVMKEWSNAIKTFERGDADLILANVNRFKSKEFFSTQIINYNRIRVAMTKDTADIISLKTLEQEGVVLKAGDYTSMYFRDADSSMMSKIEFQSPKVALTALKAGDIKYFVWGDEPLKWKIKKLNLDSIYINEVSIPVSEVHIIGRDKELIDQIDDQYSRLKQSGELEQILNKWIHPDRIHDDTPPVAIYVILGLVLLAVLIISFDRLAKAHVMRATRNSTMLNEMMYKALHMGNFKLMQYDIANDRVANRYGSNILPPEGLTFEEFASRIHPDQQEEFRCKTQLLLCGRERKFELNKRWNAGTPEEPQWLNFNGHAICEFDEHGRPAYIVNAIHDLTQDMEEDRALREIECKYERLSNMPLVAMAFYDKDGWLLSLNDQMKKICGITDDNPESQRFWDTVCMFDIPLFRNAYSKEDRNDLLVCQHMEYPEIGLDNYIEFHICPLFDADGNIVNYFCTTLNITDEHERIKETRLTASEHEAIVEQTALHKERLIYLLRNSERHLMRTNLAEQTISFYRSPDAPEYVHEFETFVNDMLVESDREAIRKILYDTTTRTPQQYIIHLARHSEGQPGTVFSITFNPITDADGNIIGHEGISSDITNLHDSRIKLDEMTKLAKESIKMKSGFMASMTHELRTPLNAIVGFTGVLEALGESEERAEYVRIIRNSSDMLQRLINDIIEASSINDASLSLKPIDLDFSAAFDDICLTLVQRVQNPEVTFIKDNPYNNLYTTLDIDRVQQMLTSFVTNAVKFTHKGHIRVGYRYENRGLHIYCEDTGIGIPEDKQEKIFERFVKLDEFVQGTGMGLAIAKSMAEHMGGEIGVVSKGKDQGSTFWFWLPCERRLS